MAAGALIIARITLRTMSLYQHHCPPLPTLIHTRRHTIPITVILTEQATDLCRTEAAGTRVVTRVLNSVSQRVVQLQVVARTALQRHPLLEPQAILRLRGSIYHNLATSIA